MEQGRTNALIKLERSLNSGHTSFAAMAQIAAELMCGELAVGTSSVWLFDDTLQTLMPVCRYQRQGAPIEDRPLRSSEFPSYFDFLHTHAILKADSARLHPATAALNPGYLIPHGIHSMLDVGLYLNGKMVGILCVESLSPRRWQDAEVQWLSQVGHQLTLALGRERGSEQRNWLDLFKFAIDQSTRRIIIAEINSLKVVYANEAYLAFVGQAREQVVDQPVRELGVFQQHPQRAEQLLQAAIAQGEQSGEISMQRHDGTEHWFRFQLSTIVTDQQERFVLLASEELTGSHKHRHELERLAWRCQLTGLYNRYCLQRDLKERAAEAMLLFDLNGFKSVNDGYGDPIGDKVLIEFARRLSYGSTRLGEHRLYRIGADEFVVAFSQAPTLPLEALAETMRKRLEGPFSIEQRRVNIGVSVAGWQASQPLDEISPLVALDLAMAEAKKRRCCWVFDLPLLTEYRGRTQIESDLDEALSRRQFQLMYQPVMDMKTDRIMGTEALLRWQHPQLGLMYPGRFIELAEQTGHIQGIGRWVLESALYQLHLWQRRWPRFQMHVNVSVKQLLSEDLFEICWSQLNRYRIRPGTLVLEITETSLMEDLERVNQLCDQLGELGLVLAIDDFGTGYSSMSYLKQLPVDKLKIDRTFVADLEGSSESRQIVPAIIAMGKALGLSITAEGVENEFQATFLRRHLCDQAQGFLYSKAVLPQIIEGLLAQQSPEPVSRSIA
ncbi:GGDEF domain-containing protein [Ferrimonas pelagia]|uniref:EAL domain-containing protein n=1 Tax=Ferrimonas pelagia TaxID=1177826 RepID=A0ABP9EAM2_9GAMM